jgi:uncharacterized membrane protein
VEHWIFAIARAVALAIDAMALTVIAIGTVIAFISALRLLFVPADACQKRAIWLGYARWLVAGLTFQLAADIVESSIATSWDAVGRLAAIAAIRTFLNYFLERDVAEVRGLERERSGDASIQG